MLLLAVTILHLLSIQLVATVKAPYVRARNENDDNKAAGSAAVEGTNVILQSGEQILPLYYIESGSVLMKTPGAFVSVTCEAEVLWDGQTTNITSAFSSCLVRCHQSRGNCDTGRQRRMFRVLGNSKVIDWAGNSPDRSTYDVMYYGVYSTFLP